MVFNKNFAYKITIFLDDINVATVLLRRNSHKWNHNLTVFSTSIGCVTLHHRWCWIVFYWHFEKCDQKIQHRIVGKCKIFSLIKGFRLDFELRDVLNQRTCFLFEISLKNIITSWNKYSGGAFFILYRNIPL